MKIKRSDYPDRRSYASAWSANRYKTDPEYRKKCSARNRARWSEYKAKVYEKLGGKCAVCGFDDPRALQIDHINGDGYEDRKSGSYAYTLLRKIFEDPESHKRYQILCANHNWIKRNENQEEPRHYTQL